MTPHPSGHILETERLLIREFTLEDAAFILELLNEPAFIQYIADKGVRDLAGAGRYLRNGPFVSYAKNGFGLWMVALKDGGDPIGMCGPIRRDVLPHPDLGFALLARHTGKGYAFEATSAVLAHARHAHKLDPILAITAPENSASIKLLGKLGFRYDRTLDLPGYTGPSRLFVHDQ